MKKIKLTMLLILLIPMYSIGQYGGGIGRGEARTTYFSCINPVYGGHIVGAQTIYSGDIPAEITCDTLPGGHTGNLQFQWQYSEADDSLVFNDISGATDTSYQPPALTENQWYRRVARVACKTDWVGAVLSNVVKIHVLNSDYEIEGYARYYNNPQTPLNGLMIILKQGDTLATDTAYTSNTGFFEFYTKYGTYGLEIKSAAPGGTWQTWNGVNMTDYLLVYKHATNGPQLAATPPVVRISADVKAPQTPPVITSIDASAIQMAAKYGWGNPSYFQIPKWVFSGTTAGSSIHNINLVDANVLFNIAGLCAGDVNGTYLPPSGNKEAKPNVELISRGAVPIAEEIVFPVYATRDMDLGAITLLMDFDPARVNITGIDMPQNGGVEPWFEVIKPEQQSLKSVLKIGWASLESINISENEAVILIHAKLTGLAQDGQAIRITLNSNPLSELADAEGNVLEGVKLAIADASDKTNHLISLPAVVNPNPASDKLNIAFCSLKEGQFSAELINFQGGTILTSAPVACKSGWNKTVIDIRQVPVGIYMLKMTFGDQEEVSKVIVNR